eukprot:scaffold1827_cov421-Prasinococcus_capsulatus_cf.AAC.27
MGGTQHGVQGLREEVGPRDLPGQVEGRRTQYQRKWRPNHWYGLCTSGAGRGTAGELRKRCWLSGPAGENKLLSSKRRWQPFDQRCQGCKQKVAQNAKYCHTCAYAKGLCAMCGKEAVDISAFKMSEGGPKNWDDSQAVVIGPKDGGGLEGDVKKKKKKKAKDAEKEAAAQEGRAGQAVTANVQHGTGWVWDSQTNYYYSPSGMPSPWHACTQPDAGTSRSGPRCRLLLRPEEQALL